MKQRWFWFLVLMITMVSFADTGMAGIMSKDECSRRCAEQYRNCKKKETAASAVDDISCHELREMCNDRCDNVAGYVNCKEKCHGDADCLKDCKGEFSSNVDDYRPYLEHRKRHGRDD